MGGRSAKSQRVQGVYHEAGELRHQGTGVVGEGEAA